MNAPFQRQAEIVSWSSWITLAILTATYAMNIADRYVLSTLIEPIRHEFALSDAAAGLLTGAGLALFYVTAGVPLGWLADRTDRRAMLATALGAWSLLTMACGWTRGFWDLFAFRTLVGIGEAGGTPPTQSLLADIFPPRLRPGTASLFALGATLGSSLGALGGGWLGDHFGWRSALIVFGAMGLPLALIVRLTVREPVRGRFDRGVPERSSLRETLAFMRGQPALHHLLAGTGILTFWSWGLIWWTPAFLGRTHGLSPGEAGALLAPMHLIGGTIVTLATAALSDRLARRDPRWPARLVMLSTLVALVPATLAYTAPTLGLSAAMLWIFVPVSYLSTGPTISLIQNLVPGSMRAITTSASLFVSNLANLAVAPLLIGWASDRLGPHLERPDQALGEVLAAASLTGLWAAWHYGRIGRTLKADMARAGSVDAA